MTRRREPKNPKSCHERALGLLAVRPRSRRELERRLLAARFDSEEIADVLARLERVGLVDDAEFARLFAEHRFGSRKEGARAVLSGLRAAGISADLAASTVEDAPDDEEERALDLVRGRAAKLGDLPRDKAYARLSSLLMRRGYRPEIARSATRRALALEIDDG